MKGADNPTWKTHNTLECRFKEYYKKRMASANPEEPLHKRVDQVKSTVVLVMQLKKALKKKLRSVLQDMIPAISAVQTASLTD